MGQEEREHESTEQWGQRLLAKAANLLGEHFRDKLTLKVKEFEGGVWFDAGLQKFIQAQASRYLSAHYRDWYGSEEARIYTGFEMDVRCASMAGRFMITFEATEAGRPDDPKPGTSVTFIADEDSPHHRTGYQSYEGDPDDVLKLCDYATHHWGQADRSRYLRDGETIGFGLEPSDTIAIGGLSTREAVT